MLYWTDERPSSGWAIIKNDEGTGWRAEQISGPLALTDSSVPALLRQIDDDENQQRRRFTETQIRTAVTATEQDPDPVIERLRTVS